MIALLKLVLIFTGIVVLLSRKWNLGLVLLLACAATSLLFAHPIDMMACDVVVTITGDPAAGGDPLALRLALIVVMIMILGELLRQTASLERMVETLQQMIPSRRAVIAALPALIGLLPMVGGAMFSAPMVDEVGNHLEATPGRKTFINLWFRHLWEPVLPLYPSLLLAAELLGVSIPYLIEITWPLTAAAAAGGLLFGLLGLPRRGKAAPPPGSRTHSLRVLAGSIWPIALVVILPLILRIDDRIDLILSLVVTIALTLAVKRIPLAHLGTILRRHIPWGTVLVIFGALAFRNVLENSGAIDALAGELTALHIPLAVVAFAVPFVVGLLTGLIAAAYSVGFPMILPLVMADGGVVTPGWIAWLMAGGFIGVMCSPMHLCLGLTRGYFKAEWRAIYRFVLPAAGLVMATAAVRLLFF